MRVNAGVVLSMQPAPLVTDAQSLLWQLLRFLHFGYAAAQLPVRQQLPPKHPPTNKKPNFILLVLDDFGYGSCCSIALDNEDSRLTSFAPVAGQ
jgi:hypothetical protein